MCGWTYQFIGLINCENATIEAVLQVYVGISQQCNELLALILHACKGDGDLIIVQLLWQNGQKTRLHHRRHHLTILKNRDRKSKGIYLASKCLILLRSHIMWKMEEKKLSTINKTLCLSFSPSAVQPTHKAPEPQLCAAGQTWSWGGRATAALKTQQAGSPGMQHWAEGHRYTYTEPPAIWITEIQREQGKETPSELVPSHLLCMNNLSRNSGFFISWKNVSSSHKDQDW